MVVPVKTKTIIFVAILSIFLSSNSFAVTGGLDYSLELFNTPPAQTSATLTSLQTTPEGAETRIPRENWDIPAQGRIDLLLGRIEYGVPVFGRKSYTTTFIISVTDNVLGATDCTFIFNINVEDQAFGPVSVVAKATANGLDSSVFAAGPGVSNKRCQVFTSGLGGPRMTIYSRSQFVP
jgi:hypothetical protein